jgi:hypothetical protein
MLLIEAAMANSADESSGEFLRLDFNRRLMFRFADRWSPPMPVARPPRTRRCSRTRHEFAQKQWERYALVPTKSALSGARRADVSGFGVSEHHGDGSALPMLVQSGNLSLEIWSSGGGRAISRLESQG